MCNQKNLDSSSGPNDYYLYHFWIICGDSHTTLNEEINGLVFTPKQLLAGRGPKKRGKNVE